MNDNKNGLMKPTTPKSDMMADMRKAFGPSSTAPQSLEQKLKSLKETDLQLVLRMAQMVKLAHGFTPNNTEQYISLVSRMYPRLNSDLRSLVAEILEDAQPVPAAEPVVMTAQDDPREKVLSEYESILSMQPTADDRVAAALQSAMADTLSAEAEKQTDTLASPSTNDDFLARLTQSESSGNSQAEITIEDGRKFIGSLQFGAARLADYKSATGKRFTQDEFKADEALQDEVALWHIADIDKSIDALGDAAKGYDRDGLRSVAHLGGKGSMRKFVKSGGEHNPADELGTSLKDYYDKFSSKT